MAPKNRNPFRVEEFRIKIHRRAASPANAAQGQQNGARTDSSGRDVGPIRPALVQGVAFVPDSAPWFQLLSVKQKAEHLYLRYRRNRSPLDV